MKTELKTKSNINWAKLQETIKQFKLGGTVKSSQFECAEANSELGQFILQLLWVRDQAHIFHWQTKLDSQHVTLGTFYEDYLDELDELIESILGRKNSNFTLGTGHLYFMDLSDQNLKTYLDVTLEILTIKFESLFPNTTENLDVYHTLGDLLELFNKLKYLLQRK
jgi:hypothetical protein